MMDVQEICVSVIRLIKWWILSQETYFNLWSKLMVDFASMHNVAGPL